MESIGTHGQCVLRPRVQPMVKVPLMESMSTGDKSTSEIERKGEIELSGSAASESGTRIWLGGFGTGSWGTETVGNIGVRWELLRD